MKTTLHRINRKTHYWGAAACALPVLIIVITGILLMLRHEFSWIQPPTVATTAKVPTLPLAQIIPIVAAIPDINIRSWQNISRLDIRPGKGVIKVRGKNQWEVQLNQQTGEVLQVAYRRSGTIEALHEGSFFHEAASYWLFLPAAIILLWLALSGVYLFVITFAARRRHRLRLQTRDSIR